MSCRTAEPPVRCCLAESPPVRLCVGESPPVRHCVAEPPPGWLRNILTIIISYLYFSNSDVSTPASPNDGEAEGKPPAEVEPSEEAVDFEVVKAGAWPMPFIKKEPTDYGYDR